jgi:hypothetical protein
MQRQYAPSSWVTGLARARPLPGMRRAAEEGMGLEAETQPRFYASIAASSKE